MSTTRISKNLASQIAKKLLAKKLKSIQTIQTELSTLATEKALKCYKPELLKAFETYVDYFGSTKQCFFIYENTGQNIRSTTDLVSLNNRVPTTPKGYNLYLDLNLKDFHEIKDLQNKLDEARKDYKKAMAIVENTILNLRTPVQLKKHFPEAYDALPQKTIGTMLPMVNLDQVRSLIK
ncbi:MULTISPECIES: hypothetical protein [Sphingobacterium]|uniref:Nucleotide modification associated domain-containing protein n=1 Tax=Sphingobacterium populi TaxID=1812824 RepID=A0ABW5UAZ8_9SPHI|nr:hypothetical protein [Sphingobacterium sp. CFCC 11742]